MASHEAYAAAHLNPWLHLRAEFAAQAGAGSAADASRPHHLRCVDALLQSTQDGRARESSGIDAVAITWIVDPFGAQESLVSPDVLEARVNTALTDARGWLLRSVLEGSTHEVLVRDPGDRHAPLQWLTNGQLVLGKPGSEILVGNTLRGEVVRFVSGAFPYVCRDT